MSTDQQIHLIEAIGGFVAALCWPSIVLLVLIYLGASLRKFLENAGEFTFSAAGVEASLKKQQQAEASKSLLPEVEERIRQSLKSKGTLEQIRKIVSQTSRPKADEQIARLLSGVADRTVDSIRESNFVSVDPRPLVGPGADVWELPYKQFATVSDFLDNLWYLMQPFGVPSMKYGTLWILRDTETGKEFTNMGRSWARRFKASLDARGLADVGIQPGMKLQAVPLG